MRTLFRVLLVFTTVVPLRATPPGTKPELDIPLPTGISYTVSAVKINKLAAELGVPIGIGERPPQEGPSGERRGSLGTMRLLVILVKTAEAQAPFDREYVRRLFFEPLVTATTPPQNASVADFYQAASGERFRITGEVLDWLTLTNRSDYWISQTDSRFVKQVAEYAHRTIHLAPFDNDDLGGVGAPTQKDGSVDFLAVIYACAGSSCSSGAYRSAYSWLTSTRGTRWEPPLNSTNGTAIDNFIFVPAGALGTDYRIGVPCHEIGHFLGLPDLYRRGVQYPTDIGHWDVMCWGCANRGVAGDPFFGSSKFPPLFSAWSRDFLGWGTAHKLNSNQTQRLMPARDPEGSFLVVDDLGDTDERILAEYHTPPTDRSPWGRDLIPAKSGFLVWHADHRVGERGRRAYAWPSSEPGKGQNDDFFDYSALTTRPNLRAGPVGRPLLRLVTADGRFDLQDRHNMLVDEDDLFTGGALAFTNLSKGFSLYRAQPQVRIVFDPVTEMVTRTNVPTPDLGVNSSQSAPAAPLPLAGDSLTSHLERNSFLDQVSAQPEVLSDPRVKSEFTHIHESVVAAYAHQTSNEEILEAHRKVRTYHTLAALNSNGAERVPAAKVKAFLGSGDTHGQFVTGVWGTNIEKIVGAKASIQKSNARIDAYSKASSLPAVLGLPSTTLNVIIDETPRPSDRVDATKGFDFRIETKVNDKSIPLSFATGTLHYQGDVSFEGMEVNYPVRIKSQPLSAKAEFPQSKAIDLVKTKLRNILPDGSTVSAELNLYPTGPEKDQWILAHKVRIDAPRTTPLFTWVDARTGEFLK